VLRTKLFEIQMVEPLTYALDEDAPATIATANTEADDEADRWLVFKYTKELITADLLWADATPATATIDDVAACAPAATNWLLRMTIVELLRRVAPCAEIERVSHCVLARFGVIDTYLTLIDTQLTLY